MMTHILADRTGPCLQGTWRNIRLIPDPGTGEILNVGVMFCDETGANHVRLLANFERLECLYGDRLDLEHLRFLFHVAQADWAKGSVPCSPSPQLVLSEPKYASGDSVDEILEDLYGDTVTLEPSKPHATHANRA